MSQLQQIQELRIPNAQFDGTTLPEWLPQLTALRIVSIPSSLLTGTLDILCDLPLLEEINLVENSFESTIPSCITNLTSLTTLRLGSPGLTGTIPFSLGSLIKLEQFTLNASSLHGTIPESIGLLQNLKSFEIDHAGQFVGDFPPIQAPNLKRFKLSGTLIEKPITAELLLNSVLNTLDLSDNEFYGTIPDSVGDISQLRTLDLSDCSFEGTIPKSFANATKLRFLSLFNNELQGSIPDIFGSLPQLRHFDAYGNHLIGTIPVSISTLFRLESLQLRSNQLTGTIPPLPVSLEVAELQENKLTGPLDFVLDPNARLREFWLGDNQIEGTIPESWAKLIPLMEKFSISDNRLEGTIPSFQLPHGALPSRNKFTFPFLDFASNNFTGSLPDLPSDICPPYILLDFSSNMLSGEIPDSWTSGTLAQLEVLLLGYNRLTGSIPASLFRPQSGKFSGGYREVVLKSTKLRMLDITRNQFEGDIGIAVQSHRLTDFYASRNLFYGSVAFESLSMLERLDMSENKLNESIRWNAMVEIPNLKQVFFKDNPLIPPMDEIPIGATVSSTSVPLILANGQDWHTSCSPVSVSGKSSVLDFSRDSSLFSYEECHCSPGYYGPHCFCVPCPSFATCDRDNLTIAEGNYAYFNPAFPSSSHTDCANLSLTIEVSESNECTHPILAEPCLSPNCLGAILVIENSFNLIPDSQCRKGSSGRLCSQCDCNPLDDASDCFHTSAKGCVRCKERWTLKQALVVLVPVFFLAFSLVTGGMYLWLKHSRKPADDKDIDTKWDDLVLKKRCKYRCGLTLRTFLLVIPIIWEFLQVSSQLTSFFQVVSQVTDLVNYFKGMVNGSLEDFGLNCVLASLNSPLYKLLQQLLLPPVLFIILSMALLIADWWSRLRPTHYLVEINDKSTVINGWESESDSSPLLQDDPNAVRLETPRALTGHLRIKPSDTSSPEKFPVSIPIVKVFFISFDLFYFRAALASLQYWFWTEQPCSHIKYVQLFPYMKFDDAANLRLVSAIFWLEVGLYPVLLFVLGFIYFRYKHDFPVLAKHLKKHFDKYRVLRTDNMSYAGKSHLNNFAPQNEKRKSGDIDHHQPHKRNTSNKVKKGRRHAWWGVVPMVRRLLIAVLIASLSQSNAWYYGSLLVLLSICFLFTLSFTPYKLPLQNAAEALILIVQILNVLTMQLSGYSVVRPVQILVTVLDSALVMGLVVVCLYLSLTGETSHHVKRNAKYPPTAEEEPKRARLMRPTDELGDDNQQ